MVGVCSDSEMEVVMGWCVVWERRGGCKRLVCGLKKKGKL